MNKKKLLIEERNSILSDMNLIVLNLTKTKDDIEMRTLNQEFKNKKKRVEEIDKELRNFKGETREMKKGKVLEFRALSTQEGANFLENDVAKEVVKKIFEGEKVLEGIKLYNSINHQLDVVVENGIGADAVVVGEGLEGGIDDTIDTKKVSFESERLTTTINVTNKMLQDTSFDLDSYIMEILTRRLRRKLVDLVINGTEDNKFIGLLNKTDVEVNALDYDALIDLIYTMPCDLVENNVVICNRQDFKKILKIKSTDGTPIVLASIEGQGAKYTILGYEIIVNERVEEGTVIFANLSQAIGMLVKDGITVTKVSNTDANLVRKGLTQFTVDMYCNIKTLNEDAIEVLKVAKSRSKKIA
ncbi:MAG: phage major capsid protein [Clostridiales bacterium]|uniref:phage major capsid protein n=1 Tax=Terrisporobacter sp. TaxID=1965305 RepID=UPI002A538B6F|nr:phage major capsid protein [Terrisporobacter sp.]MDD7756146.1 phage major capsid protein [Clostridiales bacterium]MDY4136985.1 phage major capsid protein [Terrisporobacter sp.]MDY4737069.1 phage major capsid protein [Terrisporobacter sp.]